MVIFRRYMSLTCHSSTDLKNVFNPSSWLARRRSVPRVECLSKSTYPSFTPLSIISNQPSRAFYQPTAARPLPPAKLSVAPQVRLKVAVDVDEVLGRFLHRLNEYCKDKYGWDYQLSDYFVYEFAKIWNCSQERSNTIVHEFFKSSHFKDGIETIPGSRLTLEELSTFCDLVVVTSRQHVIQDATLEWLDRHYAGLFQDVYFGNHWAQAGPSKKKSDICRQAGAHVLIDDNVGYASECAAAGIHVLLYDWEGAYPWSKMPAGQAGLASDLITVVHNWADVKAAMQRLTVHHPAMRQQGSL